MTIRFLVVFVALVGSAAGPVSAGPVDDIVAQVSQTSYQNYLGAGGVPGILYTHAGDNRGIGGAQHDPARNNIFNALSDFGLATTLSEFTYNSSTYSNVVAVKLGTVTPNDIYIVGAHYDSASSDPVNKPGADDNASGVAGVLEAAHVLSNYEFASTLVFIAFDCEEQGLIGSNAYATAAKGRGDNILGMVSLDMIAYNTSGGNKADIQGRSASNPVKNALAGAITAYGGLSYEIHTSDSGEYDYSDHAPFEWNGYNACLLIEHWGNPYYHSASDNVDQANYIDYAFATNMVKGVVGYLGENAGVVPEPSTLVLLGMGALGLFCYAWRRR
jgi:Zn-dependent M28 family amino/carboxypeptidase